MKAALLVLALPLLAACGGATEAPPPAPEDGVTVRVTNHSGGPATVSYSFARTPASLLGSVGRLGEAEFTFAWEPGPLEFVVDLQSGLLTSNRMSTRIGDVVLLDIGSYRAQATKEGDGT